MPAPIIILIKSPAEIELDAARAILVESFISEYQQYLQPEEVDSSLNSWRDGEYSAQRYYEKYFVSELHEFNEGRVHYWVEARVNGKLAGWATFERESETNGVYMNLLVVHPDYQGKSIGSRLVMSLHELNVIPSTSKIHLLLRKKNLGGRKFYSKLGFYTDPSYKRSDNFVDMSLLEPLTWNPASQQIAG